MKTPSDDIFQLIQSMSAAEKRYFKIHFSSEKSLITELFNYVNGMKAYDEDEVKEYFKETKMSKNLKVYKIMLIDLLLKSLSSFRYKKSINSTIRQSIEEVEILTEKCLYQQAYKKLQKAKKLCYKHEEYDLLISIINLEYRFKAFYEIDIPSDSFNIIDEALASSEKIDEIFQMKRTLHELGTIAGALPTIDITNKEIEKHETILLNKLKEIDTDDYFKKKYYAHSALGHLYHIAKHKEKEFHHKKSILDLFKEHPHFIKSNPNKYWSSNFNFASCCHRANNSDEFNVTLLELKKFTQAHPFFQRKMILAYVLEISFYRRQKQYNYIVENLEPLVLEEVEKYGKQNERSVVYFYNSLMMTYLALGNHTKVQFYLRRLFNNKGIGKTFTYFYETIDMISHYESGDIDILQNLLSSKKRKIKREPRYGTPFFKEILSFFSKLLNDKKDNIKSIAHLRDESAIHSDDEYLRLLKYFLFDDWIEGLSVNRTYSEHIQSKTG